MSTTFIALYRGGSVKESKLLALSADPARLVRDFAARLLEEPESEGDAVLHEIEHGRRRALRLVMNEAE